MSKNSTMNGRPGRWMAMLLAVFLGGGLLSACTPLVRDRTLPPSIRTVHVPMILNRTSEPGLEERMTVAVQEEILADGRLRLATSREADAILRIYLTDFQNRPSSFDVDGFATNRVYEVTANILVEENIAGRPKIGDYRPVLATHFYNADPRRTTFDPEPRTMEELHRIFAREVVLSLLTGELDPEEGDPEGPGPPRDDPLGDITGSQLRLF